ncbi:hypothetical protein [Halomarina ordinaria]|uniref:MarR family transcriptional regulator n=1 Tax=Halomarina ordinaria TaxID=3033939 RepID=A0ABD5UGE8_9EURY|nr:hypothetical protein [Halomarina sp. PSRA2]
MVHDTSAHIGGVVIRLAIEKQQFSVADVESETAHHVERATIENVLAQLQSDGWIEATTSQPLSAWKSGELARDYGNMVKYARDMEGTIPVMPDERQY